MPTRIYVHVTWTTFARLPRIDGDAADFLRRFIPVEVKRHGARLIEIGAVRNHVHVLLELPGRFDVPRLLQGLKGASARIANRDGIVRHEPLRWAQGYDLRSVGPRQLHAVVEYIRSQAVRHPELAIGGPGERRPSGRHRAEPGLQPTDRRGRGARRLA